MVVRKLLKSCATPPASWPKASIRCERQACGLQLLARRSRPSSSRPARAVPSGSRRMRARSRMWSYSPSARRKRYSPDPVFRRAGERLAQAFLDPREIVGMNPVEPETDLVAFGGRFERRAGSPGRGGQARAPVLTSQSRTASFVARAMTSKYSALVAGTISRGVALGFCVAVHHLVLLGSMRVMD